MTRLAPQEATPTRLGSCGTSTPGETQVDQQKLSTYMIYTPST